MCVLRYIVFLFQRTILFNIATHPFPSWRLDATWSFQTPSLAHCRWRLTHYGWVRLLCPDLGLVSASGRPGRLEGECPTIFPAPFPCLCLSLTLLTVTFVTYSLPWGPGNPSSPTLSKLGERTVLLSPATTCGYLRHCPIFANTALFLSPPPTIQIRWCHLFPVISPLGLKFYFARFSVVLYLFFFFKSLTFFYFVCLIKIIFFSFILFSFSSNLSDWEGAKSCFSGHVLFLEQDDGFTSMFTLWLFFIQ